MRALAQLVIQQTNVFIRKTQPRHYTTPQQIDDTPPIEVVWPHMQQMFDVWISQRDRAVLVNGDDAFREVL
jgi:hypothetical protein